MKNQNENYRLVPIEASKKLKHRPLYTYLVLLFKSDFHTHRSEVTEETLARITGFSQEAISDYIVKMEEARLVEVTRTYTAQNQKKNYYRIAHPEKNFIICEHSLIEMEIGDMPLKVQSALKGFLLMVKCLCVNNCNITYYSYERMHPHLAIGKTTVKGLMPRLIEHRLVERFTHGTGYRILATCFDKGNTYPFPDGTPERYRSIYNDIRQWCQERGLECPEYKQEYISAIATETWMDAAERKQYKDDADRMARYDLPTVLTARLPHLTEAPQSLAYFVRVLMNKQVTPIPEETNTLVL